MRRSHYRQFIPQLGVYLAVEWPPGMPDIFRDLMYQNTGSIICGYRYWVKCPCPSEGSEGKLAHSGQMLNTSTHLALNCYTKKTTESQSYIYTMDHSFRYHSKKFICTCSDLPSHAHGSQFRGRSFKHFKTSVECSKSWMKNFRRQLKDKAVLSNAYNSNSACRVTGVLAGLHFSLVGQL